MSIQGRDGQESHFTPTPTVDPSAELRANVQGPDPYVMEVEAADGLATGTREYRVPDGSRDDR